MALRFSPTRGAAALVLNAAVRGPQGPAATIEIGATTTGAAGSAASVINSGTSAAAVLNFGFPGTPTIAVGNVTTLAPGAAPTVENGGTADAIELDFGLPTTPTIAIGSVTTLAPGSSATVANGGTASAIQLDFGIPRGEPGAGDFSTNTATSVDDEMILFSGTTGKIGKRSTLTGIVKAASGVASVAVAGTDYLAPAAIGVTVQGYDVDTLKADVTDDLDVGFTSASKDQGTKSSGTFTPTFAAGNVQHYVNGGAHTLEPPSTGNGSIVIDMTNNAAAGAVTTLGFTKVTGDTLTTINTNKFRLFITVGNGGSHLHKQALQ